MLDFKICLVVLKIVEIIIILLVFMMLHILIQIKDYFKEGDPKVNND